jgi:class 3 adenylate cyclase/mannose-6-phosphate isomerase-like protein (cupin superfamily)
MSFMADVRLRSFEEPDEQIEFPLLTAQIVEVGDFTVGRVVHQPGWRWSTHVRPTVGGDWCQARHVGVVLSGRATILLRDGTEIQLGPGDIVDIPPWHDGWVVGEEPFVQLEWTGLYTFMGLQAARGGALVTLLFTDLVDSTTIAASLGDRAWRELLSGHFAAVRSALDRFGGREVKTTGDGLLATFEGPARALRCATVIRTAARNGGLGIRVGVHVGEVEVVAGDVRGVAVHAAARILARAGDGEILVSDTTRALSQGAGLEFEDRGTHELKGLNGEWRLFALVDSGAGTR